MSPKTLKILVLFEVPKFPKLSLQEYLKLPDWEDERDVIKTLKDLNYQVLILGLDKSIHPLIEFIKKEKPDLIFNLCETLNRNRKQEANIAGICELLHTPYTGASPFALHLCQDKAIQKKILGHKKISTPQFIVVSKKDKKPKLENLIYPVIVKPLDLEASEGISQKSLANDFQQCLRRIHFLQKKFNTDIIVEEYIDGTDFYTAVMGQDKITVGHPIKLFFKKYPKDKRKNCNLPHQMG